MQINWNLKPLVIAVVVAMSAQAQAAWAADESATTSVASTAGAVTTSSDTSATELSPIQVRGVISRYTVGQTSAGSRTDTPIEHVPQSIVVVPKSMIDIQGVGGSSPLVPTI